MTYSSKFIISTVLMWISIDVGKTDTINVAWLCTKDPVFIGFQASKTIGALAFSLETIINDSSLLPGYDFRLRYADSACSSKNSLGELVALIEGGYIPDLVVGPLCSRALISSGLLGSDLNLPTFGWVSSDPSVQDKSEYTTLVRLLWPVSSIGEGIVLLMTEFSWRRVFLISTIGGDYGELAKGVRDVMLESSEQGFVISNWERNVEETPSQNTIRAIYQSVKQQSRILLLSVPLSELRDWMLAAYYEEMHKGDYVFIYINQQTPDEALVDYLTSLEFWQMNDGRDSIAKQSYENLFMLFSKMNDFSQVNNFLTSFNNSAHSTQWATNINMLPDDPDFYSLFLYDTMMLYARVATDVLSEGGNISDGVTLFERSKNSVTQGGATGDVIMDSNADRIPDFWLFDMKANGTFAVIAETVSSEANNTVFREWLFMSEPRWGDGTFGKDNAPPDEPDCGFRNEKCPPIEIYIAVAVSLTVLFIFIILSFFIIRKVQYERELKNMSWRVDYKLVNLYTGKTPGFGSMAHSKVTLVSTASTNKSNDLHQKYTTIANYKGSIAAIKLVRKHKVETNRKQLEEMKHVKEMAHNNINTFIGACIDSPNICVLWEYCSKGSLQDVIANEHIHLDHMFKFSISIDILKGLQYIHTNPHFGHHGNLKSSNVVVDGRWTAKVTDFGLPLFLCGQERDENRNEDKVYSSLYWTAPELIPHDIMSMSYKNINTDDWVKTTAGDIYSVGIIFKELFCRNEPYEEQESDDGLSSKEIIRKILENEQFRPSLSELETFDKQDRQTEMEHFICSLWHPLPICRPNVQGALKACLRINPSRKYNVLDNMITMMEQYSQQLEEKVAVETEFLRAEKEKSESLLLKMLPKSIVEDLKQGKQIEAEAFDSVTIYFSDIPGFTTFAAQSTPVEVVDLLNKIYSLMDSIITKYDVYKVETVGDVYVLVSGLPQRNGEDHIAHIADCALHILKEVSSIKVKSKSDYKVQLRIGIHTGPIVAGVIGLAMPRYCLFGDTINTSSRMESTGEAMKIHMSPVAFQALSKFSGYSVADRGVISVKGKGEMNTYWLLGKEHLLVNNKDIFNVNGQFVDERDKLVMLPITQGKSLEKENRYSAVVPNEHIVTNQPQTITVFTFH